MTGANHVHRKGHDTSVPLVVGTSYKPGSVFGIQRFKPGSMQTFRKTHFSDPRCNRRKGVGEGLTFVVNDPEPVDERRCGTEINYFDFAVKTPTTLPFKEFSSQYNLVRVGQQVWHRITERHFLHTFLPFPSVPRVLGGSQGALTLSLGGAV